MHLNQPWKQHRQSDAKHAYAMVSRSDFNVPFGLRIAMLTELLPRNTEEIAPC